MPPQNPMPSHLKPPQKEHKKQKKENKHFHANHPSPTAFLSWLRLATYMSIVAVAILISFHLKAEASPLEKRIALPFGLVFWCLAIACLAAGLHNYIKTVSRYSRRQALVQSGTGTQLVSFGQGRICFCMVDDAADQAVIFDRCLRLWRRRLLPLAYCSCRRMLGTTSHDSSGRPFSVYLEFLLFVQCNGISIV